MIDIISSIMIKWSVNIYIITSKNKRPKNLNGHLCKIQPHKGSQFAKYTGRKQ